MASWKCLAPLEMVDSSIVEWCVLRMLSSAHSHLKTGGPLATNLDKLSLQVASCKSCLIMQHDERNAYCAIDWLARNITLQQYGVLLP